MSQMYDEDLLENKFLQQFCDMCPPLFQSAISNEWLVIIQFTYIELGLYVLLSISA